jgi:hypothetical protein
MKKLLTAMIVGVSLYACGPSSESTTDTPGTISSSPSSDSTITTDSTGTVNPTEVPTDSTSKMPDSTSNP